MTCVAQASIDETSHGKLRRDPATLRAADAVRDSRDDPETRTTFIRNRRKVFVRRRLPCSLQKPDRTTT
jgi:hypothetical protein